jgi:hypothetical protein
MLSVLSLTTSFLFDLSIVDEQTHSHSDLLKRAASSLPVALTFTRKNCLNNPAQRGGMYCFSTGLMY